MNCPYCNEADSRVIDSRETNEGKVVRRRRECVHCKIRFSTYEEVELLNIIVLKKNGDKQPYDKRKVANGVIKALEKRPISQEKLSKLLSSVEYHIRSLEKPTISSRDIGKIVLEQLRQLDEVAYLRFASVYKAFGSIRSFQKELDRLET